VSLDWRSGELAKGLDCYQREEFFEAHEHWESVWLELEEPERSFLQSLIQMTAAFHHLQTGNAAGAMSLLRRALKRMEICPAFFEGIAVASLCKDIRAWLGAIETAAPALPVAFPRIRLIEPER
jgi:hypothetical protein